MLVKNRLAKLENNLIPKSQVMPEGLSLMEQYMWLIRQPLPKICQTDKTNLSPEEAYRRLIGKTD